jgi:outer membrane immunogenic protein
MRPASLLFAAACIVGSTQLSYAADLPVKAPINAPPAVAMYNWNGFYVGANVGYGWAHTSSDAFNLTTGAFTGSSTSDVHGIVGGGQIGYNWMFAPQWLLGVEADFDGAAMTGSSDSCSAITGGCSHADHRTDWFGTLRGRVGYAWDNVLLFGTGGGIWVHHNTDRTITLGGGAALGTTASESATTGGWTAGGGIEWGFMPHWSAKLEYLYYRTEPSGDYIYPVNGAAVNRHTESTTNGNLVRVGVNYHF